MSGVDGRRRQALLGAARLVGPDLVRLAGRASSGTIDPDSGAIRTLDTGEQITNSFAVDETGGVYIVSDAALYRFDAGAGGAPAVTWREEYPNSGVRKPGQVSPGSGTTPDAGGLRSTSRSPTTPTR